MLEEIRTFQNVVNFLFEHSGKNRTFKNLVTFLVRIVWEENRTFQNLITFLVSRLWKENRTFHNVTFLISTVGRKSHFSKCRYMLVRRNRCTHLTHQMVLLL